MSQKYLNIVYSCFQSNVLYCTKDTTLHQSTKTWTTYFYSPLNFFPHTCITLHHVRINGKETISVQMWYFITPNLQERKQEIIHFQVLATKATNIWAKEDVAASTAPVKYSWSPPDLPVRYTCNYFGKLGDVEHVASKNRSSKIWHSQQNYLSFVTCPHHCKDL